MVNKNPLRRGPGGLAVLVALLAACISFHSCRNSAAGSDMTVSGKQYFADSAVSTLRLYKDAQGRQILQKENTYYDLIDFTDRQNTRKFLVRITKSESGFIDSADTHGHFIVNVNDIDDPKSAWKKEFPGSDIDYTNKVLVVHSEGRNPNEEDTYTQYSLLSGKKLMTYTYGQLSALIPSTSHKRFLGYLSRQSATDDKPEGLAVISYVGSDEIIDRIEVKLKNNKAGIPDYTPELKMMVARDSGNTLTNDGKSVILGHAGRTFSAKDINNFAMQVNYYLPGGGDPLTLLIPVRDDHLDLDNAVYDKTIFGLTRVN